MKHMRGRAESGFTLVEIIIVLAMIGILATVFVGGSFMPSLLRSRDTKRKHDLAQVATALEGYVNDHGSYPTSFEGQIMGCGDAGDEACVWGGGFTGPNNTVYMALLPSDNKSPVHEYFYEAGPNGRAWKLYARLENVNDEVLDRNGDGVYSAEDDYGVVCGTGGSCNYGISSSNVTMVTDLSGY